jgi:hypothetical protein
VARSLPLLLLCLIVPLAAEAVDVQAATVITQELTAPRWRLVAGPEVSAPPSTVIPAQTPVLQREVAGTGQPDATLPADAQVAAAPIRPAYLIRPSLGGGLPTGFVGGWGDYFFSGSAGTPGNLRNGVPDGSLNLGFGLGDPQRFLGVELYSGIGSIKNLNANGSFGATLGRVLVNRSDLQVSVAGGVIDAFTYGTEPNPQPINGYGAVSVALPLRPGDPRFSQMVQFTVGGGGSSFAAIDSSFQTSETGVFGAVGMELLANLGLSVGMSSRSANVNLSWVPFRTVPIYVNLIAADVFANTPWGTIGVLSVGWGDNLQNGFVSK